jgi:hypothetical protein
VTRASYGERCACRFCGTDIEFHGSPRREEIAPGVDLVRGGWVDRGSGRFCLGSRRLHAPYRDVAEAVGR